MQIQQFVSVLQRRVLSFETTATYIFPLLEKLFLIETHMSFEERLHLFNSALALRSGFVACEVGSYVGASTCFLAAAASVRQGSVHAVDTWGNDAMPGEMVRDTWDEFVRNTESFRPFITVHRGVAHQVKDAVPMVDLLFVDGDHSYEGTLENLVDFVPKVVPGGLLALHDYTYETVQRAVGDYFKDRPAKSLGMTHSLQVFCL